MVVGVLRLTLVVPGARSLKEKRHVVRKITDRVRARYNVSIAEVAENDVWQRAVLGVTAVANDRSFVNEVLDKVVRDIEMLGVADLVSREMEIETYSTLHGDLLDKPRLDPEPADEKAAHSRPDRVGHLVQQKLAQLFTRGLKDPRVGLVTITGVKMSPDLREARVYWTVHGEPAVRQETAHGIEAARGWLRREVGGALGLRVVPDLHFTYDEAIDRGDRIERLLREVHDQDARRQDPASAPEDE